MLDSLKAGTRTAAAGLLAAALSIAVIGGKVRQWILKNPWRAQGLAVFLALSLATSTVVYQLYALPLPETLRQPEDADLLTAVGNASHVNGTQDSVVGVPTVLDTATLRIADRTVLLQGVNGVGGTYARGLAEYIADREITCRPTAGDRYRCYVDGWDLSEVVLFNGGGRATMDAAPELVEAERKARRERRGIWSAR